MLDWDQEKNEKTGNFAEQISIGSKKRVYWKCHVCGGEWETTVKERRGCPYCAGRRVIVGENDLLTKNPDLAAEWNYETVRRELISSSGTYLNIFAQRKND